MTGGPHISLVFREMWDSTALSLWLSIHPMRLAVNIRGIPHLAKNERDMGHPSSVREPRALANGGGSQADTLDHPLFALEAQSL